MSLTKKYIVSVYMHIYFFPSEIFDKNRIYRKYFWLNRPNWYSTSKSENSSALRNHNGLRTCFQQANKKKWQKKNIYFCNTEMVCLQVDTVYLLCIIWRSSQYSWGLKRADCSWSFPHTYQGRSMMWFWNRRRGMLLDWILDLIQLLYFTVVTLAS